MNKGKKKFKSPIKKKALLLLAGGVALGLARNPRSQQYIFKTLKRDWKEINKKYLYKIVKEFREERLVDYIEKADGSVKIVLTEKGKNIILNFDIDRIKIKKPIRWDKKWRFVFFDIPEKRRSERNVLRNKLKDLKFYEIQKSIFVHPYPCLDEVNFVIEYFNLRNMVRYGEVTNISNEEELKLKCNLF
ncbi:MAG: Transcriptional regulator, PaaX family [Candidatus Moranbacteria bacterium GW2011_GWC2_37_73]|nr:MAG: Transcriptional regulator, PaaX family [Parcubacteria group bacterium GW2011_GWC1_36_108]KKQ00126.1 MAG: Transcriptional regulator, PaaX family [Candidatus Moranbacteria bacterium GW2011_GWD1_36_198]KKQ01297.1 MAG: Transcriptional regulator, PaaX family [Candidatus Moranbacteria bacterium GW2011_GWD2_36_198]KKQ40010.1 MAG: Transcriptional regulator, PaaX family [Candidatus Moranbacteria bacterium GW2011_GWC2_37_73]HAS00226.1 hypothetical protein [Candidatus Moranbacteria bacterium]